ncbi:MAG TPA: DUF72 domain-containing protein [Oxalobacteraceae bacterium]|nr:DUF72 domain-containing protein [Oxalobacteraceae bacterium]
MSCSSSPIATYLHVGISGWSYPHWRDRFYPPELPATQWLAFYSRHFGTVELNNSFYRLPSRETFAAWRQQTPARFVFSIKASRYITHMKKLKDPAQTLPPLLAAAKGLANKLGPLLFQLPPHWRPDTGRLRAFLQALPKGTQASFELRDPCWHKDPVLELLAEFNAAFCVYDLRGFTSPRAVTADFVYLRLHGPGEPYCGRYGTAALSNWAGWLKQQKVRAAYVYFNNDQAAYAVRDALDLQAILR